MKVESIIAETIHHMTVDGKEYHRYSPTRWTSTICFDLTSEEYEVCGDPSIEKLENLFIDYMIEQEKKNEEFRKLFD